MAAPPEKSLSAPYIQHLATGTYHPTILVDLFSDLEVSAIQLDIAKSSELVSLYYTCYLLALVLDDDLPEARLLTKRLNSAFKDFLLNDPELISAYTLLRAVWSRDYVVFHQTIRNAPWSNIAAVLAGRVRQSRRSKTISLLSTAYTTIPPSKAAIYLGADSDQEVIDELVTNYGWTHDTQSGLLVPKVVDVELGTGKGDEGRNRIGKLAGLVGRLSDL